MASRSTAHRAERKQHWWRPSRPGACRGGGYRPQVVSVGVCEPPEHGIFKMCRLVLDGDMLVTQLSPHGDDLGEPFDRVVPLHNSCRHDGDILCDQSCIEAIVLG